MTEGILRASGLSWGKSLLGPPEGGGEAEVAPQQASPQHPWGGWGRAGQHGWHGPAPVFWRRRAAGNATHSAEDVPPGHPHAQPPHPRQELPPPAAPALLPSLHRQPLLLQPRRPQPGTTQPAEHQESWQWLRLWQRGRRLSGPGPSRVLCLRELHAGARAHHPLRRAGRTAGAGYGP